MWHQGPQTSCACHARGSHLASICSSLSFSSFIWAILRARDLWAARRFFSRLEVWRKEGQVCSAGRAPPGWSIILPRKCTGCNLPGMYVVSSGCASLCKTQACVMRWIQTGANVPYLGHVRGLHTKLQLQSTKWRHVRHIPSMQRRTTLTTADNAACMRHQAQSMRQCTADPSMDAIHTAAGRFYALANSESAMHCTAVDGCCLNAGCIATMRAPNCCWALLQCAYTCCPTPSGLLQQPATPHPSPDTHLCLRLSSRVLGGPYFFEPFAALLPFLLLARPPLLPVLKSPSASDSRSESS
jgi:hypothetical protein